MITKSYTELDGSIFDWTDQQSCLTIAAVPTTPKHAYCTLPRFHGNDGPKFF